MSVIYTFDDVQRRLGASVKPDAYDDSTVKPSVASSPASSSPSHIVVDQPKVEYHKKNNHPGGPEIPSFLKEIQAGLVIDGEKQKDVAETFSNSIQTTHRVFHDENLRPVAKNRIKARKDNAYNLALDKLLISLGLIEKDNLIDCSAVQLSVVSSNLARTMEKLTDAKQSNSNNVLVVVTTEQKEEKSFKEIEI